MALDGTSLTVNEVEGDRFSVLLIPHTLAVTTWGEREAGDDAQHRSRSDGALRGAADGKGIVLLSGSAQPFNEKGSVSGRSLLQEWRRACDQQATRTVR